MTKYVQTTVLLLIYVYHCTCELIQCIGTQICHNQNVTCPENEDCFIDCNGESACSFATITCPQNESRKCSLTCNDRLSCSHLTVNAHKAISLNIDSNGYQSLSYSSIYCPLNTMDSCSITYFDHGYGLNMMNIYSIHNYDAINLECTSMNTCWSTNNNPTLFYGDYMYSQSCIINNLNECASDILIAKVSIETFSTETPIITHIENDDTDKNNKIPNTAFDHIELDKYPLSISIMLLFIGMLIGIILSICCCFGYVFIESHYNGTTPRSRSLSSMERSPKRTISRRQLSSSLRDLSPELKPSNVELFDVDFIKNSQMLSDYPIDHEGDGVVVTVERYANPENKCDESAVMSPISSTWLSPKDRFHVQTDSTLSLSVCMETKQGGVAPDEFVVKGDDYVTPS